MSACSGPQQWLANPYLCVTHLRRDCELFQEGFFFLTPRKWHGHLSQVVMSIGSQNFWSPKKNILTDLEIGRSAFNFLDIYWSATQHFILFPLTNMLFVMHITFMHAYYGLIPTCSMFVSPNLWHWSMNLSSRSISSMTADPEFGAWHKIIMLL